MGTAGANPFLRPCLQLVRGGATMTLIGHRSFLAGAGPRSTLVAHNIGGARGASRGKNSRCRNRKCSSLSCAAATVSRSIPRGVLRAASPLGLQRFRTMRRGAASGGWVWTAQAPWRRGRPPWQMDMHRRTLTHLPPPSCGAGNVCMSVCLYIQVCLYVCRSTTYVLAISVAVYP